LARYTVKINHSVRGGLGKLLKYYIKNHSEISEIISYSDNRWSSGNIYRTLGFELNNIGKPSYFYFRPNEFVRYHRFNYTKKKAMQLYDGDIKETE
jgi:hypothetical protein